MSISIRALGDEDTIHESEKLTDISPPTELCRFVVDDAGIYIGILSVRDFHNGIRKNVTAGEACNKLAYLFICDDQEKAFETAGDIIDEAGRFYYVPILTTDRKPSGFIVTTMFPGIKFPDTFDLYSDHDIYEELYIHFNAVNTYLVDGWAYIPNDMKTKLTVDLIGDFDEILYTSKADIYHGDLYDKGLGDGASGFNFVGKFCGLKRIVFSSGEGVFVSVPADVKAEDPGDFLCIHPDDAIFLYMKNQQRYKGHIGAIVENYINDGKDCAKKLRQLCDRYFPENSKLILLEFASGYGRVTRHIDNDRFDVTACDIHNEAVKYIEQYIGAKTLLSEVEPGAIKALANQQFDVVFALSFFSHIPDRSFGKWIKTLYSSVGYGGILIFTTHGRVTNETAGYKIKNGYAFKSHSEQFDLTNEDYGTTISEYEYIERVCRQFIGKPPDYWKEGFWWNHQDVYIVRKEYQPE